MLYENIKFSVFEKIGFCFVGLLNVFFSFFFLQRIENYFEK